MQKPSSWRFRALSGEAAKVIADAPSLQAAARSLGVNKSSISRWIRAGKVPKPRAWRARTVAARHPATRRPTAAGARTADRRTPVSWERGLLKKYQFSSTERELLDLARRMLERARDNTLKPGEQAAVTGRFQALIKQLNLPNEDGYGEIADSDETPTSTVKRWPSLAR